MDITPERHQPKGTPRFGGSPFGTRLHRIEPGVPSLQRLSHVEAHSNMVRVAFHLTNMYPPVHVATESTRKDGPSKPKTLLDPELRNVRLDVRCILRAALLAKPFHEAAIQAMLRGLQRTLRWGLGMDEALEILGTRRTHSEPTKRWGQQEPGSWNLLLRFWSNRIIYIYIYIFTKKNVKTNWREVGFLHLQYITRSYLLSKAMGVDLTGGGEFISAQDLPPALDALQEQSHSQ